MTKELILPRLSRRRLKQLEDLTGSCSLQEGLSLSCPSDADRFYLLQSEKGALLSALAAYTAEGFWECYAFTRPDCRNKGYFSRLLKTAQRDSLRFLGCRGLLFLTDHKSPDAEKTLKAMDAVLVRQEHAMLLKLQASASSSKEETLSLSFSPSGDSPDASLLTAEARYGSHPVGSCRLCRMGETACLYSFEILPPLRGQGFGSLFLNALISQAPGLGISSLLLQVSGDNTPAMRLYEKTGFRITETLSYWRFPAAASETPANPCAP